MNEIAAYGFGPTWGRVILTRMLFWVNCLFKYKHGCYFPQLNGFKWFYIKWAPCDDELVSIALSFFSCQSQSLLWLWPRSLPRPLSYLGQTTSNNSLTETPHGEKTRLFQWVELTRKNAELWYCWNKSQEMFLEMQSWRTCSDEIKRGSMWKERRNDSTSKWLLCFTGNVW